MVVVAPTILDELMIIGAIQIERQLIRFKEDDLVIDLRKNLFDPEYNLTDGNRLHIYCKGGFFHSTKDPLRQQYEQIRFEENKKACEFVDCVEPLV